MEGVALSLRSRPWDYLLACFFFIQLPIIVFLDSQMLFPKRWFPPTAQELFQWHINSVGDYLVRDVPPFFRALITCQLFLQIPFNVALGYAFLRGRQWGRMVGVMWSVHTATTMIPILGDVLLSQEPSRNTLLAIYTPYLLIPLFVLARLLPSPEPFVSSAQLKVKKSS